MNSRNTKLEMFTNRNILAYLASMLILITLCSACAAQESEKAIEKDGNIVLTFKNGESKVLTSTGNDSSPFLSSDKTKVVFIREFPTSVKEAESEEPTESQIILIDIASQRETILVQGCKSDGKSSSPTDYYNSEKYPFDGLCNLMNPQFSPDGKRVYFESTAWVVSNAVHYYDLEKKKIFLFQVGSLNLIQADGNVSINISYTLKHGGRCWQDWLYSPEGKPIKALSEESN